MLDRLASLQFALLLLSAMAVPAFCAVTHGPFSIPVGAKNVSSITEEEFHRVPNEIRALYEGEMARQRKPLVLDLNWKNPYFGAGSNFSDGLFSIMIWGGFARTPGMTTDVLALVTCHEIGHVLGGEPKQTAPLPVWASAEGQADYFAASDCLKRYFRDQDNVRAISNSKPERKLKAQCEKSFRDEQEAAACVRIALAGKAFITVTESMTTEPHAVSFSTPDQTRVSSTEINRYPSPQCRLDTFASGALSQGEDLRPRCWFKHD